MNKPDNPPSIIRRFPALGGLRGSRRRKRLSLVQTLAETDCGAACLSMILDYHGKSVRLEELRHATGTDRDGVDALSLLQAARTYGLRGRGLHIDIDELPYLPSGSILHWEFNHFVLLERVRRRAVDLVDPAYGRRRVPLAEFRKAFTGVALTFEPGDDFEEGGEAGKGTWRYFRRVLSQPGIISKLFVTSVLVQLFLLATPVLTTALVDRIVPRGDQQLLTVLSVGFALVIAFNFLSTIVRAHLLLHLRTHMDVQMTLGFLEHLVSLPYAFFQRRSAGDLIMRLNSNATMREILTTSTMSALLDGTLVSVYLLLLFLFSPRIGLLVVGLGMAQVLIFAASRGVYRNLMTKDLHARARSEGYLVELLRGIETLKSIGAERRAVEHWSNLFVDQLNVSISRGRFGALVESLMVTLQMASPIVVLLFGATQVLNGHLSLGTMLGLTALATGFLMPLAKLVRTALEIQLLKSYVERIDDVLETPPEENVQQVVRAQPLNGRVTLEHVTFRHSSAAPPAVNDVSVDIAPGQCVAIVGRSGAGKSTLARLLIGLYRPEQGRILFDGADLSTLACHSVRCQIGIVPQDPYLFGGSVRENILMSNPSGTLESAVGAAKLAAIHDEILAMPMGYNTLLSDGGGSLSAGQRQRVALARALVHQPKVLLLDEATSALDTVNEKRIQENLQRLQCTRIIIAHRLSTVMQADLILVMDGGRVVEQGTHRSLTKRDGLYRSLVAAQLQRDVDTN